MLNEAYIHIAHFIASSINECFLFIIKLYENETNKRVRAISKVIFFFFFLRKQPHKQVGQFELSITTEKKISILF